MSFSSPGLVSIALHHVQAVSFVARQYAHEIWLRQKLKVVEQGKFSWDDHPSENNSFSLI